MSMMRWMQAARLLAKENVLPIIANQSNSFKTGLNCIRTVHISHSIRPIPWSLMDQRAVSTTVHEEQFAGMQWAKDGFFGEVNPHWTVEPDLQAIEQVTKQVMLASISSKEISVTYLTKGSFNKVYNVRVGKDDFIMRVVLPLDPWWKTSSEVATVEWIQRNTHLSVPRILAYDANRENAIGFEWILISKIPGKGFVDDIWRTVQFSAKKKLVQELAIYSSALFKKQLHGIGNIYTVSASEGEDGENVDSNKPPDVKGIVSSDSFWGDHHSWSPIPRGPFPSSKDWMIARLSLKEHSCNSDLSRCSGKEKLDEYDEHDLEKVNRTLKIINRLKPLVTDIFPSGDAEPEPSMFVHYDLHGENILVDDNGALSGVVDWEEVSALPLWKACDYPPFLQTKDRAKEPNSRSLSHPQTLYWEHMLEYEATILRQYFLDEMKRLQPGWMQVFEASQVKRDFDFAVAACDHPLFVGRIINWIDDITSGTANPRSLEKVLRRLD